MGRQHRTGCLVGVLRRLQTWSLTAIFEEYRRFSHPKSRQMDLQFIEAFKGLELVSHTLSFSLSLSSLLFSLTDDMSRV